MDIVEVRPGVFACLMGNETANAGFVVTQRGVVVIDTLNTPAHGRELAAAIQARTDRPILWVLNTHFHYDHTFGNQAFAAPVVAHCSLAQQLALAAARDLSPVAVAAWLSVHPEDRWLADELELIYPAIAFDSRLLFDLPPKRLIVRHLGGHTPDSSVVDLPEDGVLFAGDLVFEGRVPFLRHARIDDTIDALSRLVCIGSRTIVPGHGSLCDVSYVGRFLDYLERLRDKVSQLVARGLDKGDVLDSKELPEWWTHDRPDLLRMNVERVYDQMVGLPGS